MGYRVLPVGSAVGNRAGETKRGSRSENQSEHHRAVIPLDGEVRRRAARTDSNSGTILHHLHAVWRPQTPQKDEEGSYNSPAF